MRRFLLLFLGVFVLAPVAVHAQDGRFPATIEAITDTSVTVKTTRALQGSERFNASCSPYTGKEETNGFTTDATLVIPGLIKGTQYTCRIYVYPSAEGGQVQAISQDLMFTAGGVVTSPSQPQQVQTTATANRKPVITDLQYAVKGRNAVTGTTMTFTVVASDPDNDPLDVRFWVCKYEGTICYNAMNGAPEVWTKEPSFQWTATTTGSYTVKAIVRDGFHANAENPFGDAEMEYHFAIQGSPTTVADTKPPAGYEDEVVTAPVKNPFPDTNIGSLSGIAAAELYRRAVIGGYPDGQFKGQKSVNRAEAAKFLLLARFGSVEDLKNNGQFHDVVDGQWYTKFVVSAAQKSIINGYEDGSFRPANSVNTAEFLKMLTLTFELEKGLPHTYTDIVAGSWYEQYAGVAAKYELFPGRTTQLQPERLLTREEVAIAIYQYLSKR